MLSWNCVKRLVWPALSAAQMKRVIRSSILLFGAVATGLALKVQSVQALWFFTSDLVFVLLFPQLIFALFDPKANRTGSIVAFVVSFVLRVGGGEPLLGAAGVDARIPTRCRSGSWRRRPVSSCCRSSRARPPVGIRRMPLRNVVERRIVSVVTKGSSPGSSISTPRWGWCVPPAWPS